MWSKIKDTYKRIKVPVGGIWTKVIDTYKGIKIPISVKLTAIYTVILFCILLLLSISTIWGVEFLVSRQVAGDIDTSIKNVTSYLEAGNKVGTDIGERNLLVTGVTLRIYDNQQKLVYDSAPYTSEDKKFTPRSKDHDKEGPMKGDHWNPELNKHDIKESLEIKQVYWSGNPGYYLEFRRDLTDRNFFLHELIISLAAINFLGILAAILSGYFLSRRILRPLREITDTARRIEINNLDNRIEVPGSDDELKELAVTFNRMLDRIQKGVEQQRRFITDASHELRTPVTVITGYTNMLDRWGKDDPAALTEGIEAIKSEASQMQSLIQKLLFLARVDQEKQELQSDRFNLAHLIEEVFSETSMISPQHQVALLNNEELFIKGDEALLKQMLRIFIDNSIKFTPPEGQISISSVRKTPSSAEITISDSGIGIPAEDLPKIFDRFYRVDKSRTKSTGGTGLGLSIARWIAEQNHYQISVNSEVGSGTTIIITLPLSEE